MSSTPSTPTLLLLLSPENGEAKGETAEYKIRSELLQVSEACACVCVCLFVVRCVAIGGEQSCKYTLIFYYSQRDMKILSDGIAAVKLPRSGRVGRRKRRGEKGRERGGERRREEERGGERGLLGPNSSVAGGGGGMGGVCVWVIFTSSG